MEKNLLSIDWDYFVPVNKEWCGSYLENAQNLSGLWYQRYLRERMRGEDIRRTVDTGPELEEFWPKIITRFNIRKTTKVYVSDSHKFSYEICRDHGCNHVYLFDAHADLGYGGISSLAFELNCANWLGKLLQDNVIAKATIFYSPYTYEKQEDFEEINRVFNIRYCTLEDLKGQIEVAAIHICRSGAWTPPWLDAKFYNFVQGLNMPYRILECPERNWAPGKLTLSEKIDYLLHVS
ncbi:arginase [Zhaonella formicivorans]|uniref:arginase n=1 Tax=Zhaonella formicivorans TaxID=2528593 RepID=UPI0010E1DC01|nr:arginase [Zhaonella formicivorans]